MSNIESLEKIYNIAVNVFIFSSVIVLGATVISTFWGNKLQKAKDEEIKEAQTTATIKIAEANAEAKKATADAVEANLKAKTALVSIEKAKLKQQLLQNENLKLATKLEEEKLSRLRLEESISPRIIEQELFAANLEQFKGMHVKIQSMIDAEAWELSGQIAFTLKQAGWDIESMERSYDRGLFFDGVIVLSNAGCLDLDDRSGDAANALVSQFKANNIVSRRHPLNIDAELPKNTILIRVGLKPSSYFLDKTEDRISSKNFGNKLFME